MSYVLCWWNVGNARSLSFSFQGLHGLLVLGIDLSHSSLGLTGLRRPAWSNCSYMINLHVWRTVTFPTWWISLMFQNKYFQPPSTIWNLLWLTFNYWTTWRSTTRWTRTYEGLRGARLFHLVSLSLQISLTDLPGSCLGMCVCVLLVLLFFFGWLLVSFFGEIWSQSQAHSSCWPTMSRTCPAMQKKKKSTIWNLQRKFDLLVIQTTDLQSAETCLLPLFMQRIRIQNIQIKGTNDDFPHDDFNLTNLTLKIYHASRR